MSHHKWSTIFRGPHSWCTQKYGYKWMAMYVGILCRTFCALKNEWCDNNCDTYKNERIWWQSLITKHWLSLLSSNHTHTHTRISCIERQYHKILCNSDRTTVPWPTAMTLQNRYIMYSNAFIANQSNWIVPDTHTYIFTLKKTTRDSDKEVQLAAMGHIDNWNHTMLYISYTHSNVKHTVRIFFLKKERTTCMLACVSVHCTRLHRWHVFVRIAFGFS